ncbi:DEAD/DEAH box helicase [Mesobacillus zeae]|uniref:DEAD/DEAH box helicase n=1 Tax=Mesobacillus zeae TaxID=1917180 RepID=A0A398B3R8_9BACI|nr:DEAD/DEAH box helicase [Mesobacillus zeae]RID82456.1 DEAD/DEAH box helicase [Mesobacillus zeae]
MTENQLLINDLKPFIHAAWSKAGFAAPTSVQAEAMPLILEGRNVIAESPTGTGKTLAYLLPVLAKIDTAKRNSQAVILASSQELVMQILSEVQKWSEGSGITSTSLIGGANLKRQLEKLKKSPQVIIGTPGRTYELIKQKKLKMHEVRMVVLDEGDQLLVAEHRGTVESIVKSTLASHRQTMLFSATLPNHTEQAAKELMEEPEIIRIKKDDTFQSADVEHGYFFRDPREKIKVLEKMYRLDSAKVLVFMKDIGNMQVASEKLQYNGTPVRVLHSDLTKQQRQTNLKQFREGGTEMLLVTDIAARGLDIKGVTHVVHYDFPRNLEQYIHRSGRTGRFGAEGTVLSIVNERELRDLKKYCKEIGKVPEEKDFYKGSIINAEER